MKRIIALAMAICCALMFSVAADDVRYAFGAEGEVLVNAAEGCVTVYAAENRGIASAVLSMTYDQSKVRFLRCEPCEGFSADEFSVFDNEYGQVRVAFVSTAGIIMDKSGMFRLYFAPIDGECTAEIGFSAEWSELFDDDYSPALFGSVSGSLVFIASPLAAAADENGISVDHASMTVRGVAPGTDLYTLSTLLAGEPTLPDIVCTGEKIYCAGLEYLLIVEGDIDCDGRSDISDYIAQRLIILGAPAGEAALTAADMNADGKADELDVQLLRDSLLGKSADAQ